MSRGPNKQFDPDVALSKAMKVFWAYGYEAACLSELLKEMGIGRKSMYDTFGNKRSLFLKALDYYARTTLKSIREQLTQAGSPLANIKNSLQQMQTIHSMPGSKGCMLGTNIADFDTSDADVAKVMRGYLRELEEAYYQALKRAQTAGELDKGLNPRNIARMLVCTTQGMALVGRVLDQEVILDSAVAATIAMLKQS